VHVATMDWESLGDCDEVQLGIRLVVEVLAETVVEGLTVEGVTGRKVRLDGDNVATGPGW